LYSDYGPSLINAGEYKVCEKYDIRWIKLSSHWSI
jgi:hypothetical protein